MGPEGSSGRRGSEVSLTMRQRFKSFNPLLAFFMVYMALCAFNYGYDVGTFGGVQGMPSFAGEFGNWVEDAQLYVLDAQLSSIMTAMPFLGKALGCIFCGWLAEKWGRRAAILAMCLLSIVGVVLQTAASTTAQFTVGRVFTYAMTGMTIVAIPIFQAEASPRALRGMFGSTIQAMVIFGQVIATLITYGTRNMTDAKGWRIPISLQFITPVILLVFLPLIPESPRWLLAQGKREAAYESLSRLRKGESAESIQLELDGIAYAHATENKGTWRDVFDAKNRKRTGVAVLAMFGQQITGQAFPTQYGVIFYQTQGYRSLAFMFNVINSLISLVAVMVTWLFVDGVGRRPVLLFGGSLMAIFLFVLGGAGTVAPAHLTEQVKGLMVASLMLFSTFFNLSWAPVSFVVVSETAAQHVREKTNLLACVISVLTTFVTSFTCPYLFRRKYANLGAKVGFIYGSTTAAMVVATYFFIPELKGRTLEEVDQLFESGAPLRKFRQVRTKPAEQLFTAQVIMENDKHESTGSTADEAEQRDKV